MLECGISEANVSVCVSVIQVVQTLTMLLMSKSAENVKNIFLAVAICLFAQVLPLGAMLFICINNGISIGIKYFLLRNRKIALNVDTTTFVIAYILNFPTFLML